SCPSTSPGGVATSASAKRRRCCVGLTNGSGDGCAPSPGNSGSAEIHGLQSCDAAASAGNWRHKPLAAHMARGGSAIAPLPKLPCQTASSHHSAYVPSQIPLPHNPVN